MLYILLNKSPKVRFASLSSPASNSIRLPHFLNRIKEENWDKRMLKLYEKNIVNYLRTKTRFQRENPIDILFSLEYGRVVATITDRQTQKKVFAIEILR